VLRFDGKRAAGAFAREGPALLEYGGEELIAVLPGAGLTVCEAVAERIRRSVSECRITRRSTGELLRLSPYRSALLSSGRRNQWLKLIDGVTARVISKTNRPKPCCHGEPTRRPFRLVPRVNERDWLRKLLGKASFTQEISRDVRQILGRAITTPPMRDVRRMDIVPRWPVRCSVAHSTKSRIGNLVVKILRALIRETSSPTDPTLS